MTDKQICDNPHQYEWASQQTCKTAKKNYTILQQKINSSKQVLFSVLPDWSEEVDNEDEWGKKGSYQPPINHQLTANGLTSGKLLQKPPSV